MRPNSSLLLFALASSLFQSGPAEAAPRPPFPVFDARVQPLASRPSGPRIAGEAFEIRLTREASLRVALAGRGAGRVAALGVPGLDRLARDHGLSFEPEFPGEPANGARGEPDFGAFFVVHLPPGADVLALLDRAEALPEVASVSALPVLPLDALFPNDSLFASSHWYYQPGSRLDIHGPEGWEITTGDPSTVVAILDAGVIPYHPDLGGTTAGAYGNIWRNAAEANGTPGLDDDGNGYVDDVSGWDFVNLAAPVDVAVGEDWRDEDADPNDMVGHGTVCAGLVSALSDNGSGVTGTAWDVKLMPLRIGWAYSGAPPGSADVRMDFVARAVRYATRAGADVLNCSFSTANTDGLDAAITAAVHAGVTVVSSAGNNGSPDYVARRPDVVSVAATDRFDVVATFSNVNADVDLAAPGVGIVSTWRKAPPSGTDSLSLREPDYSPAISGTSFSAPQVAGAAALLQSQRRVAGLDPLPPAGVRLRLWETADDIASLNPGTLGLYGSGRLNLGEALGSNARSSVTRASARTLGAPVVIRTVSGRDRIAFVTEDAKLVVLDGLTRDTLTSVSLPETPVTGLAAVAIDNGRTAALFVGTARGPVLGYDLEGAPLPGWPTPVLDLPMMGGPAIGDLDGDGVPEIVSGSDDLANGNLSAWKLDGTPVAGFPKTLGFDVIRASVALAPLDTTRGLVVVAVNEAGLLAAYRGNGVRLPGWTKTVTTPVRAPVVARLGTDTVGTILVAGGNQLHAYNATGTVRPGFPVTLSGIAAADPAVGDVDGDGEVEIVVPVYSPFQLEVRRGDGTAMTGFPVAIAGGTIGTPVLGQVSGDARPEVVLLDGLGLAAIDAGGTRVGPLPKPGGAGTHPTVWDLGADGIPDVVAGAGADSGFYIYSAARVPPAPGASPWPTARANAQRTGSWVPGAVPPVVDDVRPAAVTDLAIIARTDTSVTLQWTATGSDSLTGALRRWLVRSTYVPMSENAFETAPLQHSPNATAGPGGTETFVFSPIEVGFMVFRFAVKAEDAAGNRSALSNVVAFYDPPRGPASLTILAHPSQIPVTFAWQADPGAPTPGSRLQVFDISGREFATFDLGTGAGGTLTWYGAGDNGERLPAGLYLVRFTSGVREISKRLVVLP